MPFVWLTKHSQCVLHFISEKFRNLHLPSYSPAMAKTEVKVPTRPVRLEVFDIHGHNGAEPLDYVAFFRMIRGLPWQQRQEKIADRIVAVPTMHNKDGLLTFYAYVGSQDSSLLLLNLANGEEEVRPVERGKLLATRTVGVIDPVRRIAVIQAVWTGVRAQQIAALFEKLAHNEAEDFENASLEFAARPGAEFRRQVMALERIQSAALTLTRPNYDWSDYPDALNGLASDSNAQNVSVSASAPRAQSLSKSRGVVKVLRELVSGNGRSILKSAEVTGAADDDSPLTTLKLNKLTSAKTVNVALEGGLPDPVAVSNATASFIAGVEDAGG